MQAHTQTTQPHKAPHTHPASPTHPTRCLTHRRAHASMRRSTCALRSSTQDTSAYASMDTLTPSRRHTGLGLAAGLALQVSVCLYVSVDACTGAEMRAVACGDVLASSHSFPLMTLTSHTQVAAPFSAQRCVLSVSVPMCDQWLVLQCGKSTSQTHKRPTLSHTHKTVRSPHKTGWHKTHGKTCTL